MSEERMTILRMLSEGKISVDEAEKLLQAVGENVEGKQKQRQKRRDERRQPRDFGEFFEEIGEEVRRAVGSVQQSDIGNTVRHEVDKAVKTVQGMDLGNVINEVVDQVKVAVHEAVDGAAKREIIDEENWTFNDAGIAVVDAETSNGHVAFHTAEGGEIRVRAQIKIKGYTREAAEAFAKEVKVSAECEGEKLRVYKEHPKPPRGVNVSINYEIEGPKSLDLELRTVNGNISAHGSITLDGGKGQVQLRTQNGNIRATIIELRHEGLFTNTNGNIDVHLGEGCAQLTATSTNGNVSLRLSNSFDGQLDAHTTNGRVSTAADLGTMSPVKRTRVEGPIGAGGDTPVRVHTLNGNVAVGRINGEE